MSYLSYFLRGDLDELLDEDVFFNYLDYSPLYEDTDWA